MDVGADEIDAQNNHADQAAEVSIDNPEGMAISYPQKILWKSKKACLCWMH